MTEDEKGQRELDVAFLREVGERFKNVMPWENFEPFIRLRYPEIAALFDIDEINDLLYDQTQGGDTQWSKWDLTGWAERAVLIGSAVELLDKGYPAYVISKMLKKYPEMREKHSRLRTLPMKPEKPDPTPYQPSAYFQLLAEDRSSLFFYGIGYALDTGVLSAAEEMLLMYPELRFTDDRLLELWEEVSQRGPSKQTEYGSTWHYLTDAGRRLTIEAYLKMLELGDYRSLSLPLFLETVPEVREQDPHLIAIQYQHGEGFTRWAETTEELKAFNLKHALIDLDEGRTKLVQNFWVHMHPELRELDPRFKDIGEPVIEQRGPEYLEMNRQMLDYYLDKALSELDRNGPEWVTSRGFAQRMPELRTLHPRLRKLSYKD